MDRHQEATSTSQLGWHLKKSPRQTLKILLKKGEK